MKSISIVIPCYNEQAAISEVIPRTQNCLDQLQQSQQISSYEIIVMDDKSTDSSLEELKKYENLKVFTTQGHTRGYGKTLKEGFVKAQGTWVGFFDMDNSYRPEDLPLFINEINKNEVHFVMGQRPLDDHGMSFVRGFGNWFYRSLARGLYNSPLNDVCSGFRFFHRDLMNEVITVSEEGLNFSIELTLKMITQKISIQPIPIQYDDRIGSSKLSVFHDGWAFLKVLMSYKLRGANVAKHSQV